MMIMIIIIMMIGHEYIWGTVWEVQMGGGGIKDTEG
jgi:hypothetical protein